MIPFMLTLCHENVKATQKNCVKQKCSEIHKQKDKKTHTSKKKSYVFGNEKRLLYVIQIVIYLWQHGRLFHSIRVI